MRSILISAVIVSSFTQFQSAAIAQTGTTAAPGKCARLGADFDQVEKALASRWANSIADNSAPRATVREMENANDLSRASMIITLMQANKCALPDHAPSLKRYLSAALTCATERLKSGPEAPACKMETWQPKEE
jgi:hypothetical protein